MPSKRLWTYVRYSNFAVTWGVSTVIYLVLGVFGGRWLDHRFGVSPLFLLLGVLAGIGMSFKTLFTELGRLRVAKDPNPDKKDGQGGED